MTHHVLQVTRENRMPVLIDLTSAPGRTVVFTRTKHGARGLARRLNRSGVPAVELHGNLNQNARTRNLDAFHSGRATTLVATDIAARGIHVDDVALVIHADPPVDPKAYLHRSGRTARAGASGSVITLALPDQAQEVRQLTRSAGITPTTTKITSERHAVLGELAPGPRVLSAPVEPVTPAPATARQAAGDTGRSTGASGQAVGGKGRGRRRGSGRGRGGARKPAAERDTRAESRPASGGRNRRRRSGSAPAVASGSGASHSAAAFSARRR